jgi:hypothetical protein
VQQSVNSNLVLFLLKSDGESNTKKVEYIHIFPMGIYLISSDQRFRCYGFLPDDRLLKLYLDRLQRREKNKFWGCSGGILPLSCISKNWTTLPAFHRLLIQPHRTNGLDVAKFCASATLLKTVPGSTTVGRTKFRRLG